MTEAENFGLHLELAPSLTVTPELKRTVAQAFSEAGLPFDWRTMGGDPCEDDSGRWGAEIAAPSLHVVVSTLDTRDPVALVHSIHAELGFALGLVRRDAPDVPLGIESLTGSGSTRFAFRPEATAASIREGLDSVLDADPSAGVIGWDERCSAWIAL